jgi:hypothetical protein
MDSFPASNISTVFDVPSRNSLSFLHAAPGHAAERPTTAT